MYSIELFKVRLSYISGTMRRPTPWMRACSRTSHTTPRSQAVAKMISSIYCVRTCLEERIERADTSLQIAAKRESAPQAGRGLELQ